MSRRALSIIGVLILMGISAGAGILGYNAFVGGSGEASQPISAPTLAIPTPNLAETQVVVLSTQVANLTSENATLAAANGSAQVVPTTAPVEAATSASAANTSTGTLFRIVPDESQVRFRLDEVLLGKPNTVVGTTNEVAGDIFVDLQTPANSQVGVIRINVRTLTTDNENRNQSLRSRILQSTNPDYEFSEFTPTAVTGLPDKIDIGQEIKFQITGDLKVRDITQSVTFDVTATLTTADRLQGTASAHVTRAQFNLIIPSAPGVANVSDDVTLEIDFVATKVQS
jgi:polyisoprenoid-binding protein YceI